MQKDILEKKPNADLKVYAIWFNMVRTDSRDSWPGTVLSDPRVTHLWDEGKIVGTWYPKNLADGPKGEILWDSFLLYPRGARWQDAAKTPITWGASIVQARERLAAELPRALAK